MYVNTVFNDFLELFNFAGFHSEIIKFCCLVFENFSIKVFSLKLHYTKALKLILFNSKDIQL